MATPYMTIYSPKFPQKYAVVMTQRVTEAICIT